MLTYHDFSETNRYILELYSSHFSNHYSLHSFIIVNKSAIVTYIFSQVLFLFYMKAIVNILAFLDLEQRHTNFITATSLRCLSG